MLIRYNGRVGTIANNDFGMWSSTPTDDSQVKHEREIEDAQAAKMIATGLFEKVEPVEVSIGNALCDPLD